MKGLPFLRRASSKWITHTLLLSIIPVLLFGTLIYYLGSWIVQQEIHRSSQESLSQVRYQVESKMKNIEQMASQIALNSDIIALMNIGDSPSLGAALQSNEARYQLLRMKNATDTVHSIYFYHLRQKIVIGTDFLTGIDEERVFRDTSWLGSLEELISRRQHQLWITPRQMVSPNSQATSTLTLVRVLPLLYSQAKAGIVVNLNPDFLDHTISRFPLGADGKLLVINEANEIIAQTSGGGEANGNLEEFVAAADAQQASGVNTVRMGDYFLTAARSDANGWKYAMIVPSQVPRQQVEFFRWIIILITAVLCSLVVYSAYFTHSRFQNSIRAILDKLSISRSPGDPAAKGDAIIEIEDHINRLMKEVKEGKSLQEVHMPLLRTHYLHASIHGNTVDISKMSQQIEQWGLFPYNRFSVMAVQMDSAAKSSFSGDQALFLFAVSNIGSELPKLHQGPYRLESILTQQHTVFILNYEDEASAEFSLVAVADQLRLIVKKILKQTVTIGIGTPVDSIHDLVYSYREALQALRMNWINVQDEVLPYSNMTLVAEKLAQYPAADEDELLNALRERDRAASFRNLVEFRRKIERDLASFNMAKTFYLQLVVVVIRLVQEYEEDISRVFGGTNPYEEFFRMDSIAQIHEWFKDRLIEPILHYMESVKRQKTKYMIQKTLDLIHAKYKTDLSLQSAADEIGIRASYLSQLFKDERGETFIEYVTSYRLEQAQSMLLHTELTLHQVAEEIGYSSVQQLFRVFRKKLGMTPGEYREKYKQ